jgi:hypothetical protein
MSDLKIGSGEIFRVGSAQDPFTKWCRRLAEYQRNGNVLRFDRNIPEPGTYRVRAGTDGWLPVHIFETHPTADGEIAWKAQLNAKPCDWHNVWPRCAVTPVSAAAYKWFQEKGKWPDDVTGSEDGDNFEMAPDHERLSEKLKAAEAEAISWFESIGSTIQTQEQADKAANFAVRFMELETEAAAGRMDASAPIKVRLDKIRLLYTPTETKAGQLKHDIKKLWLLPSGFTVFGSSSHKRSSTVVRQFATFSDIRAFARWVADHETSISDALYKALYTIARRHLRRGDIPPGVEAKKEEVVV